ncbi:MAG: glutamine--fructose-6-phosphate transaminase (isomerizing) [Patescibacteria group bacterium]|nr:glutamine--fructose-6-phosphate transaminase (isomerizing) [Patescibacteria group bacterium]
MCGIFGYVGKKQNAAEVILSGLKLLEYRGYDSWGITVRQKRNVKNEIGKFIVEKNVGKIGGVDLSSSIYRVDSTIGIGHTRWATHGGVTVKNAHPHLDCKNEIAMIHNGIIENYAKIKEDLIKKGHEFISETDTEIVPHLIEEFLKKEGFASAVRDAFNLLKGLNAIVVASSLSKQIIACKTGSPLVIGKSDNGFFIASDATGIIKHTRELMFLKDREMVILGDDVQLLTLPEGKKKKLRFEKIDWKIEDVDKGKFDHFMLKEIYEQPKVVRNIAENYTGQIKELKNLIDNAKGTFLIGAGTAFHACLAGSYFFSKIAHTHINTTVASEFNYLEDFLNSKSLIIALSQSGETIDVIEPLNHAKEKGSKIIAITNALGSTIYRMADYKLLLGAGPEKAVASTKAYIAKVALLLMLSYAVSGRVNRAKKLLLDASKEIDSLLDKKGISKIKKIASVINSSEHLYTIGRGTSFSTALEAALKIKEVSYLHTEGLAGGELKHGPIALISKGTPCIVFTPQDETFDAIISNATEIKSRGGLIIGVGPKKSPVFDYWVNIKDVSEAQIIPHVVFAQILAYYLAVQRGYDPDKPRNLAKSVTVK